MPPTNTPAPDDPLTELELEGLLWHGCSSGTQTPPMVRDAIVRACLEIKAHRRRATELATTEATNFLTQLFDEIVRLRAEQEGR